ncbi:MAG: Rrf2 family transcriptional regulator [Elusimicrobiota bacterium]
MVKNGQAHPKIRIVRFSNTARYAIEALAQLAKNSKTAFSPATQLAETRNLPQDFIGKIFQRLARQGLLTSQRGPGGGYALAQKPENITLWEIVAATGEVVAKRGACLFGFDDLAQGRFCVLHERVARADKILTEALQTTTLADFVGEVK